MNRLTYEYDGKKYKVNLSAKPLSIGRSDEADHTLPTKLASRIHAQVINRDGNFWLEDLGSSNGTGLNGEILEDMAQLKPGDVIRIGDVQIKFEGDAPKPKGPPDHLIARVVYQPGKGHAAQEILIRKRVTIGRKPKNDLQIDSKAISSQHLEIENRNGLYVARDLASSNGTTVNDSPIKETTLRNGDQIMLGKQALLYFIDPAAAPASTVQPTEPAQQQALAQKPDSGRQPKTQPGSGRKPAIRPASGRHLAAEKAGSKGVYSAIDDDADAVKSSPAPYLIFGLIIGCLLLVLGFIGGQFIEDSRQPDADDNGETAPINALTDSALSFEGKIDKSGNPEGWTVSFESAGGTTAELLADDTVKHDGERSLRISLQNLSSSYTMLVLTTAEARKLELGGAFMATLQLRGEGVSSLAVGFASVNDKGQMRTLGIQPVRDVSATEFSEVALTGVNLDSSVESEKLRLMISGSFSRLWIDRFEVTSTSEDPPVKPLRTVSASGLHVRVDPRTPAKIHLNTDEATVTFQPRLMNHKDQALSATDLWSINEVASDGGVFRSIGSTGGLTRDVSLSARVHKNTYITEQGLKLEWTLMQTKGSSLAMDIKLPIGKDRIVAVSDRFGTPLFVDRDSLHAYSYATVSEVMVDGTDISISFPDGAVLWLDFTRSGELSLTVRSARKDARNRISMIVNNQPLMFARQYQLLFDEAKRLMDVDNYSASEARLKFLTTTSLPGKDANIVNKAQDLLADINAHRTDLKESIEKAWQAVSSTRNHANILEAERVVLQYLHEFPADTETVLIMQDRRDQLSKWTEELKTAARTPEEMAAAELQARGFFNDATASYNTGNILMALMLLDNVVLSFSDTSVYPEAKSLIAKINKELQDPVARDKAIDAELEAIDEDIKYEDYERGRQKIFKLFRKFPDSPRNRDIMKRLRQIEAAFD
ncbi:MAG: FHA domain-containing protein [Planctomycetota bacterium]